MTEDAFQKASVELRALLSIFPCSYSLVKITYQLPMDMISMMISVP